MIATRIAPATALSAVLLSTSAAYAAPKVAADIPAVHSIASAVMQGVGEPSLIVSPGASPHGYSLKPSEAQAVADAELIFWIGPGLTPWLEKTIETLGADAEAVALIDAPDLRLLEFRTGATFEEHDHGDHDDHHGHGDHSDAKHDDHAHDDHAHDKDEHAHDEHGHDDHADAKHDDHAKDEHAHDEDEHGHEEHADKEHGHDEHGHDDHAHGEGEFDPHIWLDPANGRAMALAIAAKLSQADPSNAALYKANAAGLIAEIDLVETELRVMLKPVQGRSFVVFHDAYHYFEARFDVEATGALSVSDATAPGPARVEEIRALIEASEAACVFTEPQFDKRLVLRLIDGTDAKSGELDPQGLGLEIGPAMYPAFLRKLGTDLAACLS